MQESTCFSSVKTHEQIRCRKYTSAMVRSANEFKQREAAKEKKTFRYHRLCETKTKHGILIEKESE